MASIFKYFKNPGILGINARNLLYIKPYNKDKSVLIADDKIKTKAFLSARGIPVPKLYGVIGNLENLRKFDFNKLPETFVLKPNLGYGGEGIIPVVKKEKGSWISIDHEKYTIKQFQNHIQDILDGRFSVTNLNDKAFFEQLITVDETLGRLSYKGLPDIRIIVHNLIPVMAMLRLPTRESKGKANLHQGAIGVGIDIAKGETTNAIHHNKIITELPEIGKVRGVKIPEWDKILNIACQAQLATNLGYLAADIAIDKTLGPILLEINARAGLSVQIANLAPLRKRLERIKGLKIRTVAKGIRIGKEMFGRAPEKEKTPNGLTDKKIVGIEENAELIMKNQTKKVSAFLDTGIDRSIIDENFAHENHLLENNEDYDDEKSTLKIKLFLAGKRIQSIFDVEKIQDQNYKIIVGLRDLGENFLIDPSIKRKPKKSVSRITSNIDYHAIDDLLTGIDTKIKLLYYLRPVNLEEERKKFFMDFSYNPQFIYPELQYDPAILKKELLGISFDDSPVGILFFKKSKEILKKIDLHESRGQKSFTLNSIELFGKPSKEQINLADQIIKSKKNLETENEDLTAEDAQKIFTDVFDDYGLASWKVEMKETLVANCIAGKNNRLFLKKSAKFSRNRIKSLIIHEIETHLLTAENGKQQPFKMFNRGFADYLATQEGLALYNVKTQGLENEIDRIYTASLLKATELAFQHSFAGLFLKLLDIGLPQNRAFRICIKLKRGLEDTSQPGAFTKDHLYFVGERQVEEFIRNGGKIEDLYLGKFNLEDLEDIKRIPDIKPPLALPKWLIK
jgi:alpha-L-glutamate ligase-like protein/uncharacterized protein (TIGR02421 family)